MDRKAGDYSGDFARNFENILRGSAASAVWTFHAGGRRDSVSEFARSGAPSPPRTAAALHGNPGTGTGSEPILKSLVAMSAGVGNHLQDALGPVA